METTYWDKEIETANRKRIEAIQLDRLKKITDVALRTPFYGKHLAKVKITSGDAIRGLEDLQRIPFTTKDDLRGGFPKGFLAIDMQDVIRIHLSSGTTGVPTIIYFSKADVDHWTELLARSIVAAGANRSDIFQNMMTYGLFTGGLGLHYGAERVGMAVIPISGGNTKRQVEVMKSLGSTVLHVTPSYLLHIHSRLEEFGVDQKDLALRKAFIGAEPHSENVRLKIENLYGIDAYNSYGLSELNGPGVAFECVHKNGMHIWEDTFIAEIIDPDTGEILPDGQQGELVLTNLVRVATPILRYRTRDLASILTGDCPCGRKHRRLSRIMGRTDDMLIINGVNVFPSQIEEKIMKMPEVGTNYLIYVDKKNELDRLTIKVELYPKLFTGDPGQLEAIKAKIKEEIKSSIIINPGVELHEPGTLPVSEGKAKRVIDARKEQ
jgi:phenylacetate-CoA ligase